MHPAPQEAIFRREALEQYRRGSTAEGHPLEIEPVWLRRAWSVIMALLAAALLLAYLVPIDREAAGVGVIRNGRLVSVVPARYRQGLRPALPMQCELMAQPLTVQSVSTRILSPAAARRLLGPDGARLWAAAEPAVTVEAALPPGHPDFGDGVAGPVRIRLGRQRVLTALIPALRWLDV